MRISLFGCAKTRGTELTVDKLMELSYNHRQINFACRSIWAEGKY